MTASDRRIGSRQAIELSVEYKRLNTFFADYTRNISKGGTFIRTERPRGPVTRASWNGVPLPALRIDHAQLVAGGELVLD